MGDYRARDALRKPDAVGSTDILKLPDNMAWIGMNRARDVLYVRFRMQRLLGMIGEHDHRIRCL